MTRSELRKKKDQLWMELQQLELELGQKRLYRPDGTMVEYREFLEIRKGLKEKKFKVLQEYRFVKQQLTEVGGSPRVGASDVVPARLDDPTELIRGLVIVVARLCQSCELKLAGDEGLVMQMARQWLQDEDEMLQK